MANAGEDTNGSQFFITFDKTPWLDGKHVVFGEVVSGTKTIDAMEKVGSNTGDPSEEVEVVDCGEVKCTQEQMDKCKASGKCSDDKKDAPKEEAK